MNNVTENKKIMKLDNNPEKGQVTCIKLMPGIDLLFNEFNINEHIEMEYSKSKSKIIEINYCKSGRYGCTIQENKQVYLGEGEIEANIGTIERINSEFPLGYYIGISLIIDIDKLDINFKNIFQEIFRKIIELYDILKNNNYANLLKADFKIIRAFKELYEEQDNIEYLKLKVLEIIILLKLEARDRMSFKNEYFRATDINKIEKARNEVVSNLDTKITLTELALKYNISLTNFKKCFKEVYGNPYYTYLKKYKIHKAIHYLEDTKLSISDIALKVGYENPSKFISAFKELVGYTPREYRNKNVRLEHLQLFGVEIGKE